MAPRSARHLALVLLIAAPSAARAAEPATTPGPAPPAAPGRTPEAGGSWDKAAEPPATAADRIETDPDAARDDATRRLKQPDAPADGGLIKGMRALLQDRQRHLQARDEAVKLRAEAELKDDSGKGFDDDEVDLERNRALLARSAEAPDALLPDAFYPGDPQAAGKVVLDDLKRAIDEARLEVRDHTTKLDELRRGSGRAGTRRLAGLRNQRDAAQQRQAALAARPALSNQGQAPPDSEARELDRQRQINANWEARAAAERLGALEAMIAREVRVTDSTTLALNAQESRLSVADARLRRMQECYLAHVKSRQTDLQKAAAVAKAESDRAVDPVDRHRALRNAQLLVLEAAVIKHEHALSASTNATLLDQINRADRAVANLADLRQVVADDRPSALVAARLKNDFRRIEAERESVAREELPRETALLAGLVDALTEAQLDLADEARDGRFELDAFLETLPVERRAAAGAICREIEQRHRAILERKRMAVEGLAARTEATQVQIRRRLAALDQQYAFIRTQLFWVRDADPIGLATVRRARIEVGRVARSIARLAEQEPGPSPLAGRDPAGTTVGFILAAFAAVILPLPMAVGRRALRKRGHPDRPAGSA